MKKFQCLAVLFLITLLSPSCGLFEPEDPYKRAKEIHRFFRCKVNGKEWTNHSYDWFYGDQSTIVYYSISYYNANYRNSLIINMESAPSQNHLESIHMDITYLNEGYNKIENIYSSSRYAYGNFSTKPELIYEIDTTYNNFIDIETIDSLNQLISGKFEFRAITKDGQDTVLVNDGEFDWKVYWYK